MLVDSESSNFRFESVAAGTGKTHYLAPPATEGEWRLKAAGFTPTTTAAADGSNYTTLSLKQGSTSLGSLASSATAFTAGTTRMFTLSGGLSREFTGSDTAPDLLSAVKADTGTGAVLDGVLHLWWERVA
jgi:hypothetical protein